MAKDLIDELKNLADPEKQNLKHCLDDLIRDTPMTESACFRFKKLMKKAGRDAYEARKGAVKDFVSESVKKSLDSLDFNLPMG